MDIYCRRILPFVNGRGAFCPCQVALVLVAALWFVSLPSQSWANDGEGMKLYQEGVQAFQVYRFPRAIRLLKRAIFASPPLPNKQRLRAYLLLSVSTYNLGQTKEARKWFRNALALSPRARLPGQPAPQMKSFFERIRRDWLATQAHVPVRRRALPTPPVSVRRSVPPPPRGASQPSPLPRFFRQHWGALICFSVAGVALIVGTASGVVSAQGKGEYEMLQRQVRSTTGVAMEQVHQSAVAAGTTSIISLVIAGLAAGAGGALLVLAPKKKPK